MPSASSTLELTLPASVLTFCRKHDLVTHLDFAQQLVSRLFEPVRSLRLTLEPDPETGEEAVVIDVSTDLSPSEALSRKREYTRRWVEAVPPAVIGTIRLVLDIA